MSFLNLPTALLKGTIYCTTVGGLI